MLSNESMIDTRGDDVAFYSVYRDFILPLLRSSPVPCSLLSFFLLLRRYHGLLDSVARRFVDSLAVDRGNGNNRCLDCSRIFHVISVFDVKGIFK